MATATQQPPEFQPHQVEANSGGGGTGIWTCKCVCYCGANINGMDSANNLENLMDYLNSFPAGYRFMPRDDELILKYLNPKVFNKSHLVPANLMHDINVYNFSPEVLSGQYPAQGEGDWYFFTPRDKKYKNGKRPNRAADGGYWKATGADKKIVNETGELIGFRKALVFYRGKASEGTKTDWIMHEFRVKDAPQATRGPNTSMRLDDWVLCRIHKKAETSGRARQQDLQEHDRDHSDDENDEQERENADISPAGSDPPSSIRNPLLPTTATAAIANATATAATTNTGTATTFPVPYNSSGFVSSPDDLDFMSWPPAPESFVPATSYLNQTPEAWMPSDALFTDREILDEPWLDVLTFKPLEDDAVMSVLGTSTSRLINVFQQPEGGNITNGCRDVERESYTVSALKWPYRNDYFYPSFLNTKRCKKS